MALCYLQKQELTIFYIRSIGMRCRKASKVYKLLFWAQVASVWSPSWAKRSKGFKGATSAQRSNLYTDEAFHTEYIRYSEYRIELFHTTWHFRMFHSVTEKFHSVTEKFHSVIEKFHSVTEKCPALLASVTEKPFLHSMEKKSTKVDFSPISCKKAPFYTRNGHF